MTLFSKKACAVSGLLLCLSAVLFGAFGAHALKEVLEQNARLDTFELANRYQFYHGLALIVISGRYGFSVTCEKIAAATMLIGVLIFSASLYILSLSNVTWLGAITPLGGLLLIAAWFSLLVAEWFGLS